MSANVGRTRRSGFTLVELVVVVLVLGILAAVAGPKMFDTATEARSSGTRQSLAVIRDAIEIYRSQYGVYPGTGNNEATFKTEIRSVLRSPLPVAQIGANQNDNVRVVSSGTAALTASGGQGWAFQRNTGEFVVNDSSYILW